MKTRKSKLRKYLILVMPMLIALSISATTPITLDLTCSTTTENTQELASCSPDEQYIALEASAKALIEDFDIQIISREPEPPKLFAENSMLKCAVAASSGVNSAPQLEKLGARVNRVIPGAA